MCKSVTLCPIRTPKQKGEKIMERIAVSVTEAAEMLGMCPKTVYQLTRRADFPAFKAGNRIVIYVEGLQEWVRRQATGEGAAV